MKHLSLKNFLIIDQKLKSKVIFQTIISFISSILEIINLSLLPFIIIILFKGNSGEIKIPFFKFDISIDQAYFLIIVILIFIIKSLFNFYAIYQQEKLSIEYLKSSVSIFLKDFFKTSYLYQSKKTFAELNKMILSDTARSSNHLRQLVVFNRELLFLTLIIGVLLIRNFLFSTLIAIFLFIVLFFYIFLFKNLIKNWTQKNTEIRSGYFQLIFNFFNFLSDIKVFKLSNKIIERFREKINQLYNIQFKIDIITNSSRIYFETLIFFSTIFLIIFIFYFNIEVNDKILGDITFLVLASIRLIPALSALNSSINNIKHYKNSTETLSFALKDFRTNREIEINTQNYQKMDNEIILKSENTSFQYGEKKIFQNLNFQVNKNDIFLVDGPSGTGKSTLLKMIIGLYKPVSGKIFLNNNLKNKENIFSYVPQDFFILDDNVINNIILDLNYDENRFKKAIDVSMVSEFIELETFLKQKNSSQNFFEKSINLSGGEKQRIAIARALYQESKILILDEATNQINSELQSRILKGIIQEYDLTIIIISHDEKIKKIATNYILLK